MELANMGNIGLHQKEKEKDKDKDKEKTPKINKKSSTAKQR